MKVKTRVKTGAMSFVFERSGIGEEVKGMKVKTDVKAGIFGGGAFSTTINS